MFCNDHARPLLAALNRTSRLALTPKFVYAHITVREKPELSILVLSQNPTDGSLSTRLGDQWSFKVFSEAKELLAAAPKALAGILIDAESLPDRPKAFLDDLRAKTVAPIGIISTDPNDMAIHAAFDSLVSSILFRPIQSSDLHSFLEGAKTAAGTDASTFVAWSSAMREAWRTVFQAAASQTSVLVTGETGVGKEVVARALHRFSPRRAGPFVAVNCAALPDTLLEAELFGHEKGAFTGATSRRDGRFALANGGTLFLDEIGDLPIAVQAKLLRVLQEHSFERLGSSEAIETDVRIIAATHCDLEAAVSRGTFRSDLYYRLNVISIRVPSLRDRREEIDGLWDFFVKEASSAEQKGVAPSTSLEARRLVLRHDWPGNVRELQNAARRAVALCSSEEISVADLPEALRSVTERARFARPLLGLTLKELEREAILQSFQALGSARAAAEVLGISERKMHYRLRELEKEGFISPKRAAAASPAASDTMRTMAPQRILLAEDDPDVRDALAGALRDDGYDVVALSDGKELLEHIGSRLALEDGGRPADMVISDVRMPDVGGLDVLERIRARKWDIPVVLISAYQDRTTRERAKALGAKAFLPKPLDMKALEALLAEVRPSAPPTP